MSEVPFPNAQRSFVARRDEFGVPHIEAGTFLDALYGLGCLHAFDRGTQLLFARSIAAGRAGEQIAADAELLETDRFFRRVGLHLDLDAEVSRLDAAIAEQVAAYCAGVNAGLDYAGRSLAMWATGFQIEPWDLRAVLLIGKLLSYGGLAVSVQHNERVIMDLIHAGMPRVALKELFAPRLDDVDFDLLRQVKLQNQLSPEALEILADLPRLAGSNAWAVSPARSATGRALLAADPHLEVNRLPAIWYEAVLSWGHHYVMGATLPGCPLFAVARTPRVAWGVTYMKGDTIDYFIEHCRRGGETGWQYRRGDHWRDFHRRDEPIVAKGGAVETLPVYENAQGILDGDPDELGAGLHLSFAWTGRRGGSAQSIEAWLRMVAAQTAAEALDVARACPEPTLCWVVADRDGHIGLQGNGRFPIRHAPGQGLVPAPAWETSHHWQGLVPEAELPRIYDPPEGFIATANQEINPPGGPVFNTQPLPDYRYRRIVEVLAGLPQATLADMQRLQYDVVSLQARDLLAVFLPHLEEGPFKERLNAWDGSYAPASRTAALFQRFYRYAMLELFGGKLEIGRRRVIYLLTRCGFSTPILTAADRLVAQPESWWWTAAEKTERLRRAAEQAMAEPDEPWSAVNHFRFSDRYFGGTYLGSLLGFVSAVRPMRGCHATPFQGHVLNTAKRSSTFAPSYHLVTDLGEDTIWTNLPGGPSESRFSAFYQNDVERWERGEYKRIEVHPPKQE